jgi:hypothetical protein
MPPKIQRPAPFSWAKGNGKLCDFTEGVIWALLHAGKSAGDVAGLLDVSTKTVYDVRNRTNVRLSASVPPTSDATEESQPTGVAGVTPEESLPQTPPPQPDDPKKT